MTLVLAVVHWRINRDKMLELIEQRIDEALGETMTGSFLVEIGEPIGSVYIHGLLTEGMPTDHLPHTNC